MVDEEHDPAYKNEGGLPYQARDVAVAGGPVTVFLQYVQTDVYGYHINCFDDAVLTVL